MTDFKFPELQALLSSMVSEQEAVEDDIEGEIETLPNLTAEDRAPPSGTSRWRESVAGASKGIADKTDSDYQRLAQQCVRYLLSIGVISRPEEFLSRTPSEDAPEFIILCIMNE
ncbi:hypothetical protein BJ912DRAFT_1063599 [Pholiota molesta]|nr:hypothetical protein BJ912DRAFT_1063599 [Pholiota molesta]